MIRPSCQQRNRLAGGPFGVRPSAGGGTSEERAGTAAPPGSSPALPSLARTSTAAGESSAAHVAPAHTSAATATNVTAASCCRADPLLLDLDIEHSHGI